MAKQRKQKPYWLDMFCAAVERDGNRTRRCGERQFMAPGSGPTCVNGHGGAEGIEMSNADIDAWIRKNPSKPQPPGADESKPWPLGRKTPAVGADICPEIGGPHNYQPVDPDIENGDIRCVDCGHTLRDPEELPELGPEDVHVGDVVMLKSGGPAMTVVGADGDPTVECCWFTDRGKLKRSTFLVSTLKPS